MMNIKENSVSSILQHTVDDREKAKNINDKKCIFNFKKLSVVAKKATTDNGKNE